MKRGGNNLVWLDLVRLISALVVVIGHTKAFVFLEYAQLPPSQQNYATAVFYGFSRIGHEAVIAFFVLSGFFVGGKSLEKIRAGSFNLYDYALDRATRIYIPLVPILAITAVLPEDVGLWFLLGNFFGFQGVFVPPFAGNGPLWSLAYEIWFYFSVWLLAYVVQKRRIDVFVVLGLTLVGWIFSKLLFSYFICWIAGALFYLCKEHVNFSKNRLIFSLVCIFALIALSQSMSPGSHSTLARFASLKIAVELLLAISYCFFFTYILCIDAPRFVAKAARGAAFSYSLYLAHYPILIYLERSNIVKKGEFGAVGFLIYISALLCCIFCSYVLYFIFERNTGAVRKYFKNKHFTKSGSERNSKYKL